MAPFDSFRTAPPLGYRRLPTEACCLKGEHLGRRDEILGRRKRVALAAGLFLSPFLLFVVVRSSGARPSNNNGGLSESTSSTAISMLQLDASATPVQSASSQQTKNSPYLVGPKGSAPEAYKVYEAHLGDAPPYTPEACLDEFTDEFRANCLSLFDRSKRRDLEDITSSCEWKPVGGTRAPHPLPTALPRAH